MKFRQGRSQDMYRISLLTQLRIWSMMGVFILRRKTATVSRQNPLGRANSSLSALEAISPGTNVQIRIHVVLEFLGCIRGGGDDFVQLRGQIQAWTGSSDHSLSQHICVRRGSLMKPSNTKSPRLIPPYTESQWCEDLSAAEMQQNNRVSWAASCFALLRLKNS